MNSQNSYPLTDKWKAVAKFWNSKPFMNIYVYLMDIYIYLSTNDVDIKAKENYLYSF